MNVTVQLKNVTKNYPHINVLYALYASAHVYMKCRNNVLGANINTMLVTTIGMIITTDHNKSMPAKDCLQSHSICHSLWPKSYLFVFIIGA